MTVDFAEHFWGEKNNGFSVLYQNMKHGQTNVKELVTFLRERAAAEEEYQKRLSLITKQISSYGTIGSFAPVWQTVRTSLEKVTQLHSHLMQKLQELSKEVQKYGDEQSKHHKDVKDKESKTFDAVNYIQTTTTCLQKSRENYFARCVEHEKLKRENGHVKEISKSETRMKKAADEYKMYVDKYGKVRDDFEDRMIKAARSFQQSEENHLSQMKLFVSAYAQNVQSSYVMANQVYGDFLDQMTALDIDLLLEDVIAKKDTGAEKPLFYFFEEPDLSSLTQPTASAVPDAALTLAGLDAGGPTASAMDASPIPGHGTHDGASSNILVDPFFDGSSTGSSTQHSTVSSNQQQKKLSLWLPGRSKKQTNSSSSNLKSGSGQGSTTITPSPSMDIGLGGSNLFGGISTAATPSGGGGNLDGGKLEGDFIASSTGKRMSSTSGTPQQHQPTLFPTRSASSYSVASSGGTVTNAGNGSGPASTAFSSTPSYTLFGSLPFSAPDETAHETNAAAAAAAAASIAQQKKRERSLSMGFLRKKKEKKKKDKDVDNRSVQSSEDTKSKTSAESNEGNQVMGVDREGFSIIPEDTHNHMNDKDGKYGSSSDSESDDDQPQRIKVEIKPLNQTALQKSSASIDELRDAIGHMSCSNSGNTLKGWSSATTRRSGDDLSMDSFDPLSSRNHNNSDPWNNTKPVHATNQRHQVKVLRPAKTGDDKFNNRSFAGGLSLVDNFPAPKIDPPSAPAAVQAINTDPWPVTGDESRDQLSELSSASSLVTQWPTVASGGAGAARSRPRSTTPTHMITLANMTGLKRGSVSSRSLVNQTGEHHHGGSVGSLDQQGLPQSGASSRVPSPLTTFGPSDVIPLAMALTETVHVLFKRASESPRCITKVYGNIAVSFPSSVVNALAASLFSGSAGQRPPLTFRLTKAERIGTLLPNRQVLNQNSSFQSGTSHQLECNMPALIAHLKKMADVSPTPPFCNLDLLRYELKASDSPTSGLNANINNNGDLRLAPLVLQSFWKCESDHTDIRIDYQYNPQCNSGAPMVNLSFSTDVNGDVSQVNSKPDATWSTSNSRLSWRLTELSRHADSSGSLKARLALNSGPSNPAATTVQFQINEQTLSGADLHLSNNGSEDENNSGGGGAYRLSLLKKKTVSGKYLCEAEVR